MSRNKFLTLAFALWAAVNAQSSSSGASVVSGTPTPAASSSQTSSSAYSQSNVPTGRPLSGNYGGQYRPQVHFSPPVGFMNDPNGMFVDASGVYHLYYQCEHVQDEP